MIARVALSGLGLSVLGMAVIALSLWAVSDPLGMIEQCVHAVHTVRAALP